MHVIPFSAFDFGQSLSLDEISEHPEKFAPIKGTARHRQITFDGFLTASTAGDLSEPQRAYVQVFRTGIVEAVTSSIVRGKENNFIVLPFLQSWIIEYARSYASSLQSCGAEPPFAIMASLINVRGKILLRDYVETAIPEDIPSEVLNRDQFHFVELIFEYVPLSDEVAGRQLKPTLNHIANAAGMPSAR